MCDPLSITAVGLAAAGTVMQQMGRGEAARAQDNAAADSIRRNAASRREADALFRDSLDKSGRDDFDRRAAEAEKKRADAMLPDNLLPVVTRRQGESDTTAAAADREATAARDELEQKGMARAKLGGANDAFYQGARDILPNAERIGFVARDIQANNDLLPLYMADAGRKGGALRDIGSIVSGIGQLGGMAAGAGQTFGSLANGVSDGWNWLTNLGGTSGNLATAGQTVPRMGAVQIQ